MRTRLISLILLTPASWLLFATIILLVVFMVFNIQGWIGCVVYLPLVMLFVYLVVLPKVLLSEKVLALLKSARRHTKTQEMDTASRCYEQAMLLQQSGKRLGLSMVLKEYSHFLKRFDEEEASILFAEATRIQKDALKGKFKDQFIQEDLFDQESHF